MYRLHDKAILFLHGRNGTQIYSAWPLQLGTLGGGNHFIELAEYRRANAPLDEIPSADKDIRRGDGECRTLVEIRHTLKQFLNVKGD